MLLTGEVLQERYQIVKEIGAGGTGIIYLANDLHLQIYVVLKKIKEHLAPKLDIRWEVDILKRLHHSYLPQVYDFIQVGEEVYTVMEFIEGHDLQYYLDQGTVFEERQIRRWLKQLCQALDYLHTMEPPILHCDVKPANIMITPKGDVCLIDFNVSLKHEESVELKGLSPWYSAPEQYRAAYSGGSAAQLDGRMDLYSLGASFYRVVTGQLPGTQEGKICPITFFETSYSDGLIRILAKAMEPVPGKRYASAAKMLEALEKISRQDGLWKKWKRSQLVLCAGCGFLFVLGVVCAWYGVCTDRRQAFLEAYQRLYTYSSGQEYEKVIGEGTDILNERAFQPLLQSQENYKKEILKQVGEAYFNREDYAEAESCYREAWEMDDRDESCVRDYAVTLARQGQVSRAWALLDYARKKGMDGGALLLVQAEISVWQQDMDEAFSCIRKLQEKGADANTMYAGCRLEAGIWEKRGERKRQEECLREAQKYRDTPDLKRELAAVQVELAKACEGQERQGYLEAAVCSYESLAALAAADYIDVVNLAAALARAGRGKEGITRLTDLVKKGDTHYQVFAQLAILEYQEEREKPAADRNLSLAYEYAGRALSLYPGTEASGEDSLMEQVRRIAKEAD